MAETTTTDSASISTTEYSIIDKTTTSVPIAHTDDGYFSISFGLENMVAGDQYEFKVYEKTSSGGSMYPLGVWTATGVQGKPLTLPPIWLGIGYDITAKRLAGSDRTITWRYTRSYQT